MRMLVLIALAMLLTGAAGCVETTRTVPADESVRDDTRGGSPETSPPAPAPVPQPPRPVLNR